MTETDVDVARIIEQYFIDELGFNQLVRARAGILLQKKMMFGIRKRMVGVFTYTNYVSIVIGVMPDQQMVYLDYDDPGLFDKIDKFLKDGTL